MIANIYMTIYLNKSLMLDSYSILGEGYIESRSIRCVADKSDNIKLQMSSKNQIVEGEKISNNDKEKNKANDTTSTNIGDVLGMVDDRNINRNEITIKKIYTSFNLFNNFRNDMFNKKICRVIDENNIIENDIVCGEFVELEATLIDYSLSNYVSNLIDVIECYDSKELDKLLKNATLPNSIINYSIILKQLKVLKIYLERNSTVNMIMKMGACTVVANVNLNFFQDKNSYIYDNANFKSKVLCKIVKSGEPINLLSKTGMEYYNNEFLISIAPYLNILKENNIIIPEDCITEIVKEAIEVIPIAIYI
ncbi:hypothetical protein LGL55_09455 [Clostridium tagluense]|uniref:DUF6414 family protein n=1 Tax=Clostridium tagluense TaxID=360422 RepID=UPI001CF32650|nr:hypothetical protein [Clostridium tagluense]MCB2311477.1 hypothetical protein [Clostridium tagluense]MCB2316201.1 hypothetical protein [Clostridium tagluense]MCB2320995.1 hypothetical protein [Clostridium tagluense]MCB2326012.1 hypothetical protein [Clostridium tagluense]MCB2330735.1 hypothetical protein [Clostridium tagluense]